jgi:hypothetical protein
MRALFIALCALALVVTSHAIAQTRRARVVLTCPPNCVASPGYPPANVQWPSQRPAASGSYGAMLEGRNPASSAGF